MMLRKIRIILAAIFFVPITMLFLDFSGTVQPLFGWMAKLQFIPAVLALNVLAIVAVVLLTIAVGRLYCSVICPLGVMQDGFAWIGRRKLFRKKKGKFANKYSYSKPKTWIRLAVLVAFIVMLVAGVNALAVLFAPYSTYGRIVSALVQPLYIGANNLLAVWSESADNYMFYQVAQKSTPMVLFVVSGISALILFVLAFRNGRTYCNTICPVGTLLGYVSRFSYFKVFVDESKCTKCGLCMKNCKASCIDVKKGEVVQIDYTRCVDCGDCLEVCAQKAMTFGHPEGVGGENKAASGTSGNSGSDMSRRGFLGVMGLAAAATITAQEKTTDGGFAAIEDKQVPNRKKPLSPPGSRSHKHFYQHCTTCQLCVANCPNNVLRPSSKLENLLQPEMGYENGYCRPECTRCSDVCPAGAIKPITVEEKTAISIGHAVWVKKNCIPVADGKTCGNCARHCPSGAIQMVPIDKTIKQDEDGKWVDADGNRLREREILMIPVVDAEYCIGCGACENLCPARPFSAIYVEGNEVHREI